MNNKIAVEIGTTFLNNNTNLTEPSNVNSIVRALITGAISVSGIILLFILVLGGIGMIKAAGNSDPKSMEQGKKAATSALIGFIVIFMSYFIVKLIESITGLDLIGGVN